MFGGTAPDYDLARWPGYGIDSLRADLLYPFRRLTATLIARPSATLSVRAGQQRNQTPASGRAYRGLGRSIVNVTTARVERRGVCGSITFERRAPEPVRALDSCPARAAWRAGTCQPASYGCTSACIKRAQPPVSRAGEFQHR